MPAHRASRRGDSQLFSKSCSVILIHSQRLAITVLLRKSTVGAQWPEMIKRSAIPDLRDD